jgi:hypothetical protein
MKRFDAYDVTLRYLTAERWQARDEHVVMSSASPADIHLAGFQDDVDARDFRHAMRERVRAFSPPLRTDKSVKLLRGVLMELAELHGFDGHEVAHDGPDIERSKIEELVGRARAERSAHGRALQPRRRAKGRGFFVTRQHISEA